MRVSVVEDDGAVNHLRPDAMRRATQVAPTEISSNQTGLPDFGKSCREIGRDAPLRTGIEGGPPMHGQINMVKVFSVSKARERDELGARVTTWIAANPQVKILMTVVAQTSDREFHCLSMVFLCATD
jgi:hypothetical protein